MIAEIIRGETNASGASSGRVRDRMVHRTAARAPPRTARRRVAYQTAILRWPAARITNGKARA
jgi:hypothetical protein